MLVSARTSVGKGHRSGLLLGAKATGKTTFMTSASKFCTGLPPKEAVECSDVAIIQFDAESALGAVSVGLVPRIIDLSGASGWQAQSIALAKAICYLKPLVESGEITVVGIDLGSLDKEIRAWASGSLPGSLEKGQLVTDMSAAASGKDTNWAQVSAAGLSIYRALRQLPCLVIGMAHVKLANNNPFKDKEAADVGLARDIKAFGGEAAKLTADLAAGVYSPWSANASFQFAREIESKNVGTPIAPKWESRYVTHCRDSAKFEVGCRFENKVAQTETQSLRALLETVYT